MKLTATVTCPRPYVDNVIFRYIDDNGQEIEGMPSFTIPCVDYNHARAIVNAFNNPASDLMKLTPDQIEKLRQMISNPSIVITPKTPEKPATAPTWVSASPVPRNAAERARTSLARVGVVSKITTDGTTRIDVRMPSDKNSDGTIELLKSALEYNDRGWQFAHTKFTAF